MAEPNINLKSGNGITFTINKDKNSVTVDIDKDELNDILKSLTTITGIIESIDSITKQAGETSTNLNSLTNRVTAIEKAITLDAEFANVSSKPDTVTDDLTKNWVTSIASALDTHLQTKLENGTITVSKATNAANAANADKLDNKNSTDFATSGHTHTKSNITDFSHTHTVAELSDLQIGGTAAATDKLHIKYS